MKIVIVSGSHRKESQTRRVCNYIAEILQSKDCEVDLIDLAEVPLPLIASTEARTEMNQEIILDFKNKLNGADGFIVGTPEWDGAATPALTNALAIADKTMAYKPTMIVTVSTSRGGSYPVAQLRGFGYKNNKTLFIPDHLIVHDVKQVLNENTTEEQKDLYIRERIEWSLDNLILFAQNLQPMRESNRSQLFDERFANGMS